MPFDITDAKERIEVLEDTLQAYIAKLDQHFPHIFGSSQQPAQEVQPDVAKLREAIQYVDMMKKRQQQQAQPVQQPPAQNYSEYEQQ